MSNTSESQRTAEIKVFLTQYDLKYNKFNTEKNDKIKELFYINDQYMYMSIAQNLEGDCSSARPRLVT